MNPEIRHVGDVTIVAPIGTLCGGSETDALDRELRSLAEHGGRHLLVDLSRVRFGDNRPLGLLVRTHVQCHRRGTRMKLCGVGRENQRILEITKLSQVLDICRTEDEALRSFAAGPPPGTQVTGE